MPEATASGIRECSFELMAGNRARGSLTNLADRIGSARWASRPLLEKSRHEHILFDLFCLKDWDPNTTSVRDRVLVPFSLGVFDPLEIGDAGFLSPVLPPLSKNWG